MKRKKDINYLTNLPGASEKLHIFNADLNEPHSFNAAIEGYTGVFHLAHPVDLIGKESEEVVTKRAVEGTIGILKACLNSKTVKRVVYTSSAATVMFNHKDQGMSDESTWTGLDFFRSLNSGYSYVIAKTKTERVAWEFAEEHGLDLVTVVPPLVLGPFICNNFPGTVFLALALILGKQEYYKALLHSKLVHIDDVASAHIFLLESPNAKGRYICSSDEITIHGLAAFLSAKYPNFQIPSADVLNKIEGHITPSLSSRKLLDSEFKFKYGLNEMYDGAIQSCREKGLF
ncbi:unnamed protein product [Ilex paraguariensis]|uniref:Dihydroflavonol 4-reductase n=1 Tax=Ilex paraguariensis TaxID=185542 RepID=A0ABC8UZT7_9AQUA